MIIAQIPKKQLILLDYKPAQLQKYKDRWVIVYYVKEPAKNVLKRFRKSVPPMPNEKERTKLANKMITEINKRLEKGWSPFNDSNNLLYSSLDDCISKYLNMLQIEVDSGVKRPDTLRSYTSYLNQLQHYLKKQKINIKFIVEFDACTAQNYLDYLFYNKRISPRTYNGYLRFLSTFFTWCKNRNYITTNPIEGFRSKPKVQKKREVLSQEVREKVKRLRSTNFHYYVLCMLTYYCFIRRTELTKLKVSDIHLKDGFIVIDGSNSKNRKTESVTIPNNLLDDLAEHLAKAKADDFLFSANNFIPGTKQLTPKKISDTWANFRKKEKFDSKFQFYSLKDTGITDLLNTGVPAIKVRDQARHHDLKITESYTFRNRFADEMVQKGMSKVTGGLGLPGGMF